MVPEFARVWELIEFLRLGVSTSWFGLACPSHCYPASFSSLGFFFLLGLILGSAATASFGFYLLASPFDFGIRAHPSPTRALSRLRGYLHEWGEDWSVGTSLGLADWSGGSASRGCEEPGHWEDFDFGALFFPVGWQGSSWRRRCFSKGLVSSFLCLKHLNLQYLGKGDPSPTWLCGPQLC